MTAAQKPLACTALPATLLLALLFALGTHGYGSGPPICFNDLNLITMDGCGTWAGRAVADPTAQPRAAPAA
jgi:hypothetical protein